MLKQEPLLDDVDIIVHHCRLTSEGVLGYQEYQDGEFFIKIERTLSKTEYIITLIHELIHCRQSIQGIVNHEIREEEAYRLERPFYSLFCNSED